MILVIDNYDSFTYNLVQYIGMLGEEVAVRRNDRVTLDEALSLAPDGIMLSPGPARPEGSGICLDIARCSLGEGWTIPLFGVCLGHQAIGHVAGAEVSRARLIRHGKTSQVRHDGVGLFEGMPNPFRAVRYHSLAVTSASIPPGFISTATAEDDGEVMGIRHATKPIEGVQFHPESVMTEDGIRIIENFVRLVRRHSAAHR